MNVQHDARTALVTGAASGIGLACALGLQRVGARVIAADIAPVDPAHGFDVPVVVDLTDRAAIASIPDIDRVDILVNSAGTVGPNMPFVEIDHGDWERTFAINVTATMDTMRAVLPSMKQRGWGRVVNIASIAGKEGNPNLAAYSASKGAVIAATKAIAKEHARDGICVHSVAPAVIDTAMNADTAPAVLDYMVSKIPMGRVGRAEEVASLVLWLTSDQCSFSTGSCHDISGGRATY